jgi:hypothetical protein
VAKALRWFVALLLFLAVFPAWSETLVLRGYATDLSDGDTFSLVLPDHTRHRIRPAGVAAPERGQTAVRKFLFTAPFRIPAGDRALRDLDVAKAKNKPEVAARDLPLETTRPEAIDSTQ